MCIIHTYNKDDDRHILVSFSRPQPPNHTSHTAPWMLTVITLTSSVWCLLLSKSVRIHCRSSACCSTLGMRFTTRSMSRYRRSTSERSTNCNRTRASLMLLCHWQLFTFHVCVWGGVSGGSVCVCGGGCTVLGWGGNVCVCVVCV